jgi:hypothetical protein
MVKGRFSIFLVKAKHGTTLLLTPSAQTLKNKIGIYFLENRGGGTYH